MAQPGKGGNVRIDGHVNIWFDPSQPNQVHLTINDPDLTHPVTGKEGLHLAFSSSPESANFDPKVFNTLRGVLADFSKPHPEIEADESIPRRLDRRRSVRYCHVCGEKVDPVFGGRFNWEGVTSTALPDEPWVWGPVIVHNDCRVDVKTPFDDVMGDGFQPTWALAPPNDPKVRRN